MPQIFGSWPGPLTTPAPPKYETLQARSMSRVVFLFEGLEDAEKLTKALGLGWLVKDDSRDPQGHGVPPLW